jgi:asparagine synthase (glutamine-hydrolysing)
VLREFATATGKFEGPDQMCGIFGAISFDRPFEEDSYKRFVTLTDMVQYRGPNDSGYLAIDSRCSRLGETDSFDIFLGNRRLAILDLSPAGHMPMADGKGRLITYNGEIFNYLELRRELQALGHTFQTSTDTEVILHVYDEFGEAGFEKLNGMWAFAIADVPTRRVVLSRDRFSIKPLYLFRSSDNRLYFASEIKQLLPLLPHKEVNTEVLLAYLLQNLLDHSPETFFRGIKRIPAMCNVVVSLMSGDVREHSYAEFRPDTTSSLQQAHERFRELFVDSIRIRLRSDVKVGLLLSGGLDSSAIAVGTSGVAEHGLETFSVVFDDPRFSEEPYIDYLAHDLKIPNHKLTLKAEEAFDALQQTQYHNDEPFGGFSVVAQHQLLKMVKQHSDVVVLLSGQGGDEVFLGYLKFHYFYLRNLFKSHRYVRFARESLLSLLSGTLRNFRLTHARRYMPRLNPGVDWVRSEGHTPTAIWDGEDLRVRQLADVKWYSVPALTHYEDRNAMASSLEIRHPFLDYRLLDFALGLPAEWQLRNGWTKAIVRESLPELPEKIRWCSTKRYFNTPEHNWMKNEMAGLVQRMFAASILEELGVVDRHQFLKSFAAFRDGNPAISNFDLERTFLAEMWARKVLIGSTEPREGIAIRK